MVTATQSAVSRRRVLHCLRPCCRGAGAVPGPQFFIAVVDDEPDRWKTYLRRVREVLGPDVTVKFFRSVREMVATLGVYAPDVILHDLGGVFPEISANDTAPISGFIGFIVLRELYPTAKSVIVSRNAEPRTVGPFLQTDARGYLQFYELMQVPEEQFAAQLVELVEEDTYLSTALATSILLSTRTPSAAARAWRVGSPEALRGTWPLVALLPPAAGLKDEVRRLLHENRIGPLTDPDQARRAGKILAEQAHDTIANTVMTMAVKYDEAWRRRLGDETDFQLVTTIMTEEAVHVVIADAERPSKWMTPREREVLYWLAEGRRPLEIARILCISPRTVEQHLRKVREHVTDQRLPINTGTPLFPSLMAGDASWQPIVRRFRVVTVGRVRADAAVGKAIVQL